MTITSEELKRKYIEFFKEKGHKEIVNSSLVPENDPTVLFTTAGMHPLVPFLLGEKHPRGKRLVNCQRCLRTTDIDKVGNEMHLSFFEMLGNWSLGDYWKKEAITWSYEFLTKVLKIDPSKLHVTCFAGDKDALRDEEVAKAWIALGIPKERIYFLPKEDNWWGPAGTTGPCGPCTEMFIDTGKKPCSKECKPGCSCGKYFEIWNDVFMEYNKTKEGKFKPLTQKNVDTGMGVERTVAMLQGKKSVYEIETMAPIMEKIKSLTKISKPNEQQTRSLRIITDHLRAAVFILGDEKAIVPNNKDQGYVLRRFIRRAVRHGKLLGINENFTEEIAKVIIEINEKNYPLLKQKQSFILEELKKEEEKFRKTLEKGLNQFKKFAQNKKIEGKDAFLLFQSYGFPIEITKELCDEQGIPLDETGFYEEFQKHQEISRVGAEKKFKAGLADTTRETTRLHSACHLLLYALRKVLGKDIMQKGSNITAERIRFDFNFDRKLTDEEIRQVENIVNDIIAKGIKVERKEMPVSEAKKIAKSEFEYKTDVVSVYFIGPSIEICAGPHVSNTKEIGEGNKKFKIIEQESVAGGVRRVKAKLI
ncbi:MAG: alanine--tRNA ligase [Candidatus Pacearchaeota archaeon]|nr:alanine--tRNA ligase [Candidatus Pacearchaeota archaeon]